MSGQILVVDNYDSFTYNLVQYLGELGQEIIVKRNDQTTLDEIQALSPSRILISPGPCTPSEAGICVPLIQRFAGQIPIMGVCLGHQSIGVAFGAECVRNDKIMHGKISMINHDGKGLFRDIPNPFEATRYHSLVLKKDTVPDCLIITSQTEEGEIMGVRHCKYPVEGVQFHPESALTKYGRHIILNFVNHI